MHGALPVLLPEMRAVLWLMYKWRYDVFPRHSGHAQDDGPISVVPYPLIVGPMRGIYEPQQIDRAIEQLLDPLRYLSWTLDWRATVHEHAWKLPDGRILQQDDVVTRQEWPKFSLDDLDPSCEYEPPPPEVVRYKTEIGVKYLVGEELIEAYDFADVQYRCTHCQHFGQLFVAYEGDGSQDTVETERCHACRRPLDARGPSGFGALELTDEGYRVALAIFAEVGAEGGGWFRRGVLPATDHTVAGGAVPHADAASRPATPGHSTAVRAKELPASFFHRAGDCWQLRFVAADGTLENPPPFPDRVGFGFIHSLLYDQKMLAREVPPPEPAIPQTDKKTLAKVRDCVAELKARRSSTSREEMEGLDAQIQSAQAYIDASTRPGGRIRDMASERSKALSRVRNAINYALKYAEQFSPQWVAHLRDAIDYAAQPVPTYRPRQPISWT